MHLVLVYIAVSLSLSLFLSHRHTHSQAHTHARTHSLTHSPTLTSISLTHTQHLDAQVSLNELHRHIHLLFSRVATELTEKTTKLQQAKLKAMMERTHNNYELGTLRRDFLTRFFSILPFSSRLDFLRQPILFSPLSFRLSSLPYSPLFTVHSPFLLLSSPVSTLSTLLS